ncbi:MAG: radical SAM protein, partial [Anaerolineae bacterium]|nr:radical SAM protein [Anaerolineae bacterium]
GKVDFIVRGDAEQPLLELIELLCSGHPSLDKLENIPNLSFFKEGQIIETDLSYHISEKEFSSLDFVDLGWLTHADRYLGFQYVGRRELFYPDMPPKQKGHWLCIGRGCLFNCSFCGGGRQSHLLITGRQNILARAPERIADDLEALKELGVHQAALSLDPHLFGEDFWKALFAELSSRKVRIGLYIEVFQLPHQSFIDAFAECADLNHSQIALSLLSGDEGVRRLNGKSFTNAQVFATLKAMKRRRIPLAVYYSFNLPGQNARTLRKTISITHHIGKLYPSSLLMVYNQPHTLDPCSPMSRDPQKFGLRIKLKTFQDYVDYCRLTAIEQPGVLGLAYKGFEWLGRTREEESRMQAMWSSFAQSAPFLCF